VVDATHDSSQTFEVPVADGDLLVRRWGRGADVVVAIHGLTLVGAQFAALGDQLSSGGEITLLAPDLRGRGRSAHLGPPYGMVAHARDVGSLLDHVDARDATVLGYSAMASVAAVVAARRPDRVARVVMVDGGPAPRPSGGPAAPRPDPVAAVVARLDRRYPDVASYLDTWRAHPGLAPCWNGYVEHLLAAELTNDGPDLRPSLRVDAAAVDAASHVDDPAVRAAYRALAVPVTSLRAARNMLDEPSPLFPDATVRAWREVIPDLHDELVPDVNHYSILCTEAGAAAVAAALRSRPLAP
jgi:pimeloyl-ACP methyl ester carboxylesterase